MSVGAAEGFHSFQLSKRNLFIENFLKSEVCPKKKFARTGPDQIHTLFYGTDRTMNAEFKRMRQVCCHIGMESVTSARDGSAWVRLVDIKRRVIQVHEYS